jgi:aspartate carbamoyltransferase catalytic subunit
MNDLEANGNRTVPIINAGSGADEHPTQALLDVYTLQRSFQFDSPNDSPAASRFDELRQRQGYTTLTRGLAHKTYGFCGDIGRGRTVRSLAMLLALYDDVRLVFIAPDHPKLAMSADLRDRLVDRNVRFYEVESFEDELDGRPVIEQLDALYMTRIQREHDDPRDAKSFAELDFSRYCLTPELVARLKDYAPILHPFPRDQHFGEVPPEIDNDPRAMYFRQARNGMWIRAALLAHIFDVDHHISRHFRATYRELHGYNETNV